MAAAHFLKLTYDQNRWLFDNHSIPAARLYLALKTYFPNNRPIPKITLASMAEVSGMSRSACGRAFQELLDKGSISVRETVHHHVTLHPAPRPDSGTAFPDSGTPDPVVATDPGAQTVGQPLSDQNPAPRPDSGTAFPDFGTEFPDSGTPTYMSSKKKKEEDQEPSVSPAEPLTATQPAAPDEGGQATPIDQQPEPAPKASEKALKLTPADVPADLAPVAELFATWWNHHKGGKRTQRALATQLTELRKIAADPRGGIEAIRAQLQKAITAAELGRKWAGITFDRWVEFGRPAALQVGTGSGPRYASRRERQQAEVEQALDLLALIDPEFADPDRLDRLSRDTSTTTATIDWEAMPRA